jgi:hypothetical protein
VGRALAVVVLAVGGLAVALWFFTANDDATTGAPPALAQPGTATTDARPWGPELARGNLLVEVNAPAQAAAVRALARDVAGGELSAALLDAGQAIRVVQPEGPPARAGIMAYAHDRVLRAERADDPALRGFLEYWLGRAGG